MEQLIPDNLTFTEVGHLPIIKQFAKEINLVDTINTMDKLISRPPSRGRGRKKSAKTLRFPYKINYDG